MPEAAFAASYAGYLIDMLRTLAALAGVCLLAWLGLRALARRGFGTGTREGAVVRVVARVPLDAQGSLHLVRAGSRLLLIGVARGAAPVLIAELDPGLLDPPGGATPDEETRGE